MFRFLHLADVHLDTPFEGRSSELRQMLKESQQESFRKAVDLAIAEKTDAVLIAGDLFDNQYLSFSTERFLMEQSYRLDQAEIPCVYVTGNHDPGTRSCRVQNIDWPSRFHLLGRPVPHKVEISNGNGQPVGAVIGAGHDSPAESRNLVVDFPEGGSEGVPVVGLLHTLVTTAKSAEEHGRYAPCSCQDLASRNYAYWALGHVHSHQKISEDIEAWYPGVLQGRHPGEMGIKGGLMVTIPDQGLPSVEFRPLAGAVWATQTLDQLKEVRSLDDLRSLAAESFQARREKTSALVNWMLRFQLEGPCPLNDLLKDAMEIETIQEDLKAWLGVSSVEIRSRRLVPECDVSQFRGETHVLSEILSVMEEALGDDQVLKRLSPEVLAGQFEDKQVYLRELMTGLDYEVVSRLVGRPDAD